jgi:1-deoxy-D-xylulose-5-phosphate synthase
MVPRALEVMENLEDEGLSVGVINILSIRPLDVDTIAGTLESTRSFFTLENGLVSGGIGEHIHSLLPPETAQKLLFLGGFPDEFVPHGSMEDLFRSYGLDSRSLANRVRSLLAAGHVS